MTCFTKKLMIMNNYKILLKYAVKTLVFIVITDCWSQCQADCGLLKPVKQNETARELELLKQIKPLWGKSFQVKDYVDPAEYTYKIGICSDIDGLNKPGVGAVQIKGNLSFVLGRYNQTDIMGGTDWILLTYYGGDQYHNHCNSTGRTAKVMIVCDPDHEIGSFDVMEERKLNPDDCFYLFELSSHLACTLKPKPGLSSGSVFCILFFTALLVYIVVGVLYKRIVLGAKGLDQIPNYSFWKDFGNLQADGCDFCCRFGSHHESTAYRGIDDHLKDEEEERDDQLLNM